jgi:probable F420-dependent oxidoreductase
MKLGFGLPVAGDAATPAAIAEVARRAEALGYASLWTFQRLLYPEAPRNEYYGAPGAWPAAFRSVLDPVVALTWAAAHTRSVRLGVSVLIMPFYQPVVLAKQLASLDVVSGGRLDVGVGTGWSLDEFEAAGVPPDRRGARADEFLRVLAAVWGDDPVEFAGEFYRVPRSSVRPKPVQRPRPPLLVGGYAPGVVRRAATLGDGYTGGNIPLADLASLVARVRGAARDAGREPAAFPIVCRGVYRLTAEPLGAGRRTLHGSADEIRDDVRRYAEAGVSELFLDPNFHPGGVTPATLSSHMETLAPRVA